MNDRHMEARRLMLTKVIRFGACGPQRIGLSLRDCGPKDFRLPLPHGHETFGDEKAALLVRVWVR
jgi:hypothetical protein